MNETTSYAWHTGLTDAETITRYAAGLRAYGTVYNARFEEEVEFWDGSASQLETLADVPTVAPGLADHLRSATGWDDRSTFVDAFTELLLDGLSWADEFMAHSIVTALLLPVVEDRLARRALPGLLDAAYDAGDDTFDLAEALAPVFAQAATLTAGMTPAQYETLARLADAWDGTVEDLVHAARTL